MFNYLFKFPYRGGLEIIELGSAIDQQGGD
jgi:hypothetical protein